MSERHYRGTVVFDIIGTCFSLYQPLKSVLEAELPRTLQQLQVTAGSDQLAQIKATGGPLQTQASDLRQRVMI